MKAVGGIGRDRFDLAPQGQEESHTGVTVFNALLDIESPGVELRPGMSALVEVVIEPEKPRLVLPRAAVQRTVGDDEARFVVRQKALVGIREITVTGNVEVQFCLETITREPHDVPCLTPAYWSTLAGVPARDLARTLAVVRANAIERIPKAKAPTEEEEMRREDETVRRSLEFARTRLGL